MRQQQENGVWRLLIAEVAGGVLYAFLASGWKVSPDWEMLKKFFLPVALILILWTGIRVAHDSNSKTAFVFAVILIVTVGSPLSVFVKNIIAGDPHRTIDYWESIRNSLSLLGISILAAVLSSPDLFEDVVSSRPAS